MSAVQRCSAQRCLQPSLRQQTRAEASRLALNTSVPPISGSPGRHRPHSKTATRSRRCTAAGSTSVIGKSRHQSSWTWVPDRPVREMSWQTPTSSDVTGQHMKALRRGLETPGWDVAWDGRVPWCPVCSAAPGPASPALCYPCGQGDRGLRCAAWPGMKVFEPEALLLRTKEDGQEGGFPVEGRRWRGDSVR